MMKGAIQMQDFQNLIRTFNSPEFPTAPLYEQEVNLLLEVIDAVLARACPSVSRGTFILDGQKFGQEAQCILRFDLPQGTCDYFRKDHIKVTSDELAEEAIDEILAMPNKSRYTDGNTPERMIMHAKIKTAQDVSSGTWRDNELEALVVNTTYGRFIASCYLASDERICDEIMHAVLYAVAQAIMMMGKEDLKLQQFKQQPDAKAAIFSNPFVSYATGLVDGLLSSCDLPALRNWYRWHEPANTSGTLPLFFE